MTISFSPQHFDRLRCILHPQTCGLGLEPSRSLEALQVFLDGVRAAQVTQQILVERHVEEVHKFVHSLEFIDHDLSTRLV